MAKLKKKVFEAKTFVYCKTKEEAEELLKSARHNKSLSFIHEKSTAVMEYEPDSDFWEKNKKECYYSLYYRKRANKEIVSDINGKVIKFKKAFKKE